MIGPSGPGGIFRPAKPPAPPASGVCHDGFTCLSSVVYWPAGVARPAWPTATVYVFASFRFLQNRSWKAARSMVMKVGYFWASWAVVALGLTRSTGAEILRPL